MRKKHTMAETLPKKLMALKRLPIVEEDVSLQNHPLLSVKDFI